jgi:hypothetical protein
MMYRKYVKQKLFADFYVYSSSGVLQIIESTSRVWGKNK